MIIYGIHERGDHTDEIIVIRASDPDGKIYKSIIETLANVNKEEIDIPSSKSTELSFPGLEIRMSSGIVLRDNQPVKLTYGEYSILCYLAQRPNYIFSKDQLYTAVYGENHYYSNTIQNTICRLRNKIEPDPHHPTYIKTVVGLGYKFEVHDK